MSGSFPTSDSENEVSSSVVCEAGWATGGSFTGVTSIVTVAVSDSPCTSVTENVKLSWPLKSSLGV